MHTIGSEERERKMKNKEYTKQLRKLQAELSQLQEWVKHKGLRAVIVFEGRDTAGKGGTIRALTERVSPRVFRVVALPAPSDREKTQMYIQRYIAHFPAAGEIVVFDRSWYNRAGIEHVMGFCSKEQYQEFLRVCPSFEKEIVANGIRLIKIWLEVGQEEQERRMTARIEDPAAAVEAVADGYRLVAALVRLLARPRSHAGSDRHQIRALVHPALRRQAPRAPQLPRPHPPPHALQEGAARSREVAQTLDEGSLRRSGELEEAAIRSPSGTESGHARWPRSSQPQHLRRLSLRCSS